MCVHKYMPNSYINHEDFREISDIWSSPGKPVTRSSNSDALAQQHATYSHPSSCARKTPHPGGHKSKVSPQNSPLLSNHMEKSNMLNLNAGKHCSAMHDRDYFGLFILQLQVNEMDKDYNSLLGWVFFLMNTWLVHADYQRLQSLVHPSSPSMVFHPCVPLRKAKKSITSIFAVFSKQNRLGFKTLPCYSLLSKYFFWNSRKISGWPCGIKHIVIKAWDISICTFSFLLKTRH